MAIAAIILIALGAALQVYAICTYVGNTVPLPDGCHGTVHHIRHLVVPRCNSLRGRDWPLAGRRVVVGPCRNCRVGLGERVLPENAEALSLADAGENAGQVGTALI